jgi:long-chain acyl-CoA synthetase
MSAAAPPVMTKADAQAALTAPGAPFEMEERIIRGVPIRVFKNAPLTTAQVFAAGQTFPDREFIVFEDERIGFTEFGKATRVLAARLAADGVCKGDRVAVLMSNLPEWPVAFYAASLIGAIVAPLNAWWTGAELAFAMTDSGAKVLLCDAERWARLADRRTEFPDLEQVYVCRSEEAIEGARRIEAVIGPSSGWADLHAPEISVALDPEDPAAIFYTSGTSGRPKGALLSHRAICCNVYSGAFAQARMLVMAGLPLPSADPHQNPQRSALMSIPMFHVTGFCAILNTWLATGSKLVLMRRWDPEEAMRLIEREKVSLTGGVPTIAWQLLEHPARAKYDLSSLEFISYGGAPSAPDLVRRVSADLKSVPGNGWGMSETSAVFTQHFGPEYVGRPDSCGPPAAVGDLRIMDREGVRELPVGEIGEVWARGPQVMMGYWNNPEATAETLKDGWLRTGDLGRVDEEGYLFIVDRAKDMLIRGGENIYCVEVENALFEHPAVIDAALIGLPCKIFGEQPAAVVTLKAGATATLEELQAFLRERLAAFKVPTRIAFRDQPLPRNANGKIVKRDLKALFDEAQ